MSHTRLIFFFSITIAMTVHICLCQPAIAQTRDVAPVLLILQNSTFQRSEQTPSTDSRATQCMRRTADWERNRTPLSLFLGFIIFLASLYLLTWWRFKNTVARVIVAFVAAVVIGPAIMAVIVQDALKVCISPPGFIGSLTAPLFAWTFFGSLGTLLVICGLRYLVVRRKFSQELPTA
ncbi:MAG: hypothetical protein WCF57_19760 [Pyrinomonadaceae bacterium]